MEWPSTPSKVEEALRADRSGGPPNKRCWPWRSVRRSPGDPWAAHHSQRRATVRETGRALPIKRIPAVITFLGEHAEDLAIEQRPGLLQSLARLGAPVVELQHSTDADVTRFVAQFFAEQTSRIDVTEDPGGVALERPFVGAVAFGYLTVGYQDDSGDSSISHDAERAATSLRRLLERAGALLPERGDASLQAPAVQSTRCSLRPLSPGVWPDL